MPNNNNIPPPPAVTLGDLINDGLHRADPKDKKFTFTCEVHRDGSKVTILFPSLKPFDIHESEN